MRPRGKRTPKNSGPSLVGPPVKGKETSPIKNASNLLVGEGVQCEMGSEVFRRYWALPQDGTYAISWG